MIRINLNGTDREIPAETTLLGLVEQLGWPQKGSAAAVNDEVIPKARWATTVLREGDRVELVRPMGGGSGPDGAAADPDPGGEPDDPFVLGGRTFRSRLIVGTGKYSSVEVMQAALANSGAEMVTMAIRYMNLEQGGADLLRAVDWTRYHLLPNTAGAYTVEQAVKMAMLAREALETPWIKLEVIGDADSLLPDLQGTVEAARILVREGFIVLPYTTADLVTALRLEDAGCAAVMPLAAPIGTGQGLVDWTSIRRLVDRIQVPVIVDAGIGCATDACQAMELGADAVLVNTAIARADDPPRMALAMRYGVMAGRLGYLAGRMPIYMEAQPSSPTTGVPLPPMRQPGEVE
ncbi:MAG TPA: sulfur carrier protein ThiS [Sphingobacteriaceae bacterium]|nr:sulfur carrier protein ThiS [Sphingobacteriaceae bacterium]